MAEKLEMINRLALLNRLRAEMNRAERYGFFVSLVLLDLQDFTSRETNPSWKSLVRVIKCVRRDLRRVDQVVVYHPYGVAVVLPHTPVGAAEIVAERLREELEYTFGYRIRYTITCFPGGGGNPLELLQASESSLSL